MAKKDKKEFQSVVSDPLSSALTPDYYKGGKGAMKNIKMYQDLSNLANYEFALDESARDFETATIARAIQVAQAKETFRNQMRMRDVQMNAQLEAYRQNQQFVANQLAFNQQGANRALRDARTVFNERSKQVGFQEEELGLRRQEQAISTASQLEQLRISDFESEQSRRLRDSAANLQQRQATFGVEYEQEQQEARAAFEQQNIEIQNIVNLGKRRATGQVGVSASRAEQTIMALAGLNTAQLNDSLNRFTERTEKQKGFITEQESLSNRESMSSSQIAKAKSSLEASRLSELEVVANNRFTMQREELGETLISALNGYEQSREQIFFDKFKADAQAYAQRMSEPSFADPPKEPFKIPKIEFVKPPVPIEVPKGQVPKQPQQKTSTFGKILQIGGLALAAAAIPMTAGTFSIGLGAAGVLEGAKGAAVLSGLGGGLGSLGNAGWL